MELMSRVRGAAQRAGRVLVSEADAELRRLLVDVLRSDGHEVEGIGQGMLVIEHLARAQAFGRAFDLLVLGLDGRGSGAVGDVLPRIERHARPPVVVLTAFDDEAVARGAFTLGASAVMAKPLDLLELRRLAGSLIERHARELALRD